MMPVHYLLKDAGMKHCRSVLLCTALSVSLPAISAEPVSATAESAPPSAQHIPPPDAIIYKTREGKTYFWLDPEPEPEPVYTCKPEHIRATTPTADFTDNRDGTVTHSRSGLVWMRCALGQTWDGLTCSGTAKKFLWKDTLQAAANFNAAGGYAAHHDWRMPNIKELDSIVELQCFAPAINLEIFPGTPPWRFWSSTPSINENDPRFVWRIDFKNGYVDDTRVWDFYFPKSQKKFDYHVRLVRGGAMHDSYAAPPQ
jgi:hypothetical protein